MSSSRCPPVAQMQQSCFQQSEAAADAAEVVSQGGPDQIIGDPGDGVGGKRENANRRLLQPVVEDDEQRDTLAACLQLAGNLERRHRTRTVSAQGERALREKRLELRYVRGHSVRQRSRAIRGVLRGQDAIDGLLGVKVLRQLEERPDLIADAVHQEQRRATAILFERHQRQTAAARCGAATRAMPRAWRWSSGARGC